MSSGFDLSNVFNTAKEVANSNQDSEGPQYRFLYPGIGTLRVKLLFNPKSNTLGRITRRHVVDNSKAICLAMYGKECPICKVLANIKNATDKEIWKYNARVRGISFAQYVGSNNYKWDPEYPEPKRGEVLVLMYPWSVYQDINRLLVNSGTNAEQLIATNVGKVVNISRWVENSMTKYKCEVDAFAPDFQSCQSDNEFMSMLNDLPSLNDLNCPPEISDEIINQAREVAESLSRDYLVRMQSNPPVQASQMFSTTQQVTQPTQQIQYQQKPVTDSAVSKDFPCIGNFKQDDPKCIACLKGVPCQMLSDNIPF